MEEEPVQKPRQARGTPAFKFSYKFAIYFVGACAAVQLIFAQFSKERFYRKIAAGYYNASDFAKNRRALMSNFSPIPNTRDGPVREFERRTESLDYAAENTLDIDLK